MKLIIFLRPVSDIPQFMLPVIVNWCTILELFVAQWTTVNVTTKRG